MTCPDWSHKQINKRGEIRWQILFLMKQLNMSVSLQSWSFLDEEKEQAKKDMGNMLDYIDKLNELDTEGVEPMSHVFPVHNVFREDVVVNGDEQ